MGIVTTTSETAFTQSAETVYDFVTNPANWTKTYPGSAHIGSLPQLPAARSATPGRRPDPTGTGSSAGSSPPPCGPTLFVFTSIGRLGHDRDGNGGMEGRITVSYQFTRPGQDVTLFSRTMTIEAAQARAAARPALSVQVNPAKIDAYHEAVARGTRPIGRLTPAPAVHDTFSVFCKAEDVAKGTSG